MSLTNLESLLLAQAVWELGAGPNSWAPIAKILAKHPLLSRPKSFFTAQSCHAMYEALMKDAGLELHESNHAPHAPGNLKLAQKHYQVRFFELRELILAEESKFKTVLKEVEEIRAGIADKEERAKDTEEPQPVQEEVAKPADASTTDEVPSAPAPADAEVQEPSPPPPQPEEPLEPPPAPSEAELPPADTVAEPTKEPSPQSGDVEMQPPSKEMTEETETVPEIEELTKDDRSTTGVPEQEQVNEPSVPVVEEQPSEVPKETEVEEQVTQMEVAPSTEAPVEAAAPEEAALQEAVQHADQRQEEEEEEVSKEQESKEEEEEEASQGQVEESREKEEPPVLQMEEAPPTKEPTPAAPEPIEEERVEGQEQTESPKDVVAQTEAETESEVVQSPMNDVITPEPEPTAEEEHTSEPEEPTAPTRRSTRRRKSSLVSLPPPQTRTRGRAQARATETTETPAESENDGEAEEVKEETPAMDDETSSAFDGAATRRRGKRKASFIESAASPPDRKRPREDSEPVDEEEPGRSVHNTRARVTRHGTRTEEQVALKRFQYVIGMLHSQISQHRNGNIFHNPIKNSEAPDYHDIVKRPMDLKTIKTRVKDGVIANSLEYQRDIYLMFANAMMYNRPGSDVYAMAEDMMLESEGQISTFRQTEGLVKRGQRP